MRPLNYTAFSAANIAVNQTGSAFPAEFLLSASCQAVLTGSSPTGTLKFQGSNDLCISPQVPTNWSDIGTTLSVSSTGVKLMPKFDICYSYIRLVWTATSGTGTITAHVKTVGV